MHIMGSNPVLVVHDLERSAEWYANVLGCERTEPDPGNWVFRRAGSVTFMLGRCPDAIPASELVDDVNEFYDRATAAHSDIIKAPRDEPWGKREMALRSPDGHRFMLGAPTGR